MLDSLEVLRTDNSCMIARTSRPGIPTFRLGSGFILQEPSAWLRFLVVVRRKSLKTAEEYAKILREFIRLAASSGHFLFSSDTLKLIFSVDDTFLIDWRDDMKSRGLSHQRINKKISCVFHWLLWCQENGYVLGLVGKDPRTEELWPVSMVVKEFRDRGGRRSVRRQSPLLLSIDRQPNRHTPTRTEIEVLHEKNAVYRHAVRNSLIMSWAEEVGLRRQELLSILLSDLPSKGEIEALLFANDLFHLDVRNAKGGKHRRVPVRPHLLLITYEYIQLERQEIVDRYSGEKSLPENLFISDRGGELNPNSVSNLMSKLFKDANVRNASLHRLRAVFLTRVVESFMDRVDEYGVPVGEATVLLMAAEYAGHAHLKTLQPYLTELKCARLERGDRSLAELERRKCELKREVAILEARTREYALRNRAPIDA